MQDLIGVEKRKKYEREADISSRKWHSMYKLSQCREKQGDHGWAMTLATDRKSVV